MTTNITTFFSVPITMSMKADIFFIHRSLNKITTRRLTGSFIHLGLNASRSNARDFYTTGRTAHNPHSARQTQRRGGDWPENRVSLLPLSCSDALVQPAAAREASQMSGGSLRDAVPGIGTAMSSTQTIRARSSLCRH